MRANNMRVWPGGVAWTWLVMLAGGLTGCAAPLGAPLTVWIADAQVEIAPGSPPRPETELFSAAQKRVRFAAAINETVDAQIVLTTTAWAAGPFDVRVSDFRGQGGPQAARPVARLYRAEWVEVEGFAAWYPGHTGRSIGTHRVADALIPWESPRGGPLRVKGGVNGVVWLDVHVPATTAPGMYTATLEVAEGALTRARYAVELEVLPIALPAERTLPILARLDPRDLLQEQLRWPQATAEETRLLRGDVSHQAAVGLVDATMRLLHDHRLTPVLWASFPKYTVTGPGEVSIDWDAYDNLVLPWLTGDGFDDRVGVEHWPLPVSTRYPDAARNGGLGDDRYAALLGAYLRACDAHFAARGWSARPFLRPLDPQPFGPAAVNAARQVMEAVAASSAQASCVVFLPNQSPRGLGWHAAPAVSLPGAPRWSPPAMLVEPPLAEAWFRPDRPPYSGSLSRGAPASDPTVIAWQAFRYGLGGVWIEHAADRGADPADAGDVTPLVYPGRRFGLDQPVASARLKRLRRGQLDVEMLRLLKVHGKPLVADYTAQRVVRWAFAQSAVEHLLSARPAGWPREAEVFERAREALRLELLDDAQRADPETIWRRLAAAHDRVEVEPRGVRLIAGESDWRAVAAIGVLNRTNASVNVTPVPIDLPVGWTVTRAPQLAVAAGAFGVGEVELRLASVACNADGLALFSVQVDGLPTPQPPTPGRLAAVACRAAQRKPTIDGDLSDWVMTPDNRASDFRLVHPRLTPEGLRDDRPALATQALFARDAEYLYVAVECALPGGERPLWSTANSLSIDGAMPWGEDVVEVLLDPRSALDGSADELLTLQIKPSGLVVARRGAATSPPMNASRPWNVNAEVAARIRSSAWLVEAAIPLAALGEGALRQRVWGLNVTRLDARRGEYSSWSGARGHCYAPARLGNLLMLAGAPERPPAEPPVEDESPADPVADEEAPAAGQGEPAAMPQAPAAERADTPAGRPPGAPGGS